MLLHLHKRLSLGAFFKLIEDGGSRLTLASQLLQVYAREQNREMLRDFYYSDDRRVESAVLSLEEASSSTVRQHASAFSYVFDLCAQDHTARITAMKSAQKFFSEDKDRAFESKVSITLPDLQPFFSHIGQMMDEGARLLTFQQQLEKEATATFVGLSVNETIRTCILNSLPKRADKVKSDFKVPDKRYGLGNSPVHAL